MGNSNRKRKQHQDCQDHESEHVNLRRIQNFMQSSLTSIANNLSGRSFVSVGSQQSTYSVSRPWSRVSRRRWKESTLTEPFESSKTAWPVANIEAAFLPEFPIHTSEKSFEITDLISHGAYGKVYKAIKKDNQQLYALKILSKAQIIHERAVNQVKEEVSIQKLCGHNPFIVGCINNWQNRRRLFIVSDYIDGGELFKVLEQYGRLPEYIVAIYVAEIALALDFLHNAGIVYRDLKPENILLDQADGHIHLIDFGLSKWLRYGDRTNTLCGTLRYMAPEIANLSPYNHAVDWWSLGVLACVMLTAEYPVAAMPQLKEQSNGAEVPGKPPGTLPDSADDLSAYAKNLLKRLLDPDPRKRLRSILTLQHEGVFKDIKFAEIKAQKISPQRLLEKFFPNGPPLIRSIIDTVHEDFENFTSSSILV